LSEITVKKKHYKENEIPIYGEAVLYLVGETWYYRCWLKGENKYARKSLRTKSRAMAIERGKSAHRRLLTDVEDGRLFFAIDIKEAINKYLDDKRDEVIGDTIEERGTQGGITKGRFKTIETHLRHFLTYIGKDTKVSELKDYDLDGYAKARRKKAADITIRNEVASINAAMAWIYDRLKQTDFRMFLVPKTLKHVTKAKNSADNQRIKRQTFTREEWMAFVKAMRTYTKDCVEQADDDFNAKERLLVRYFCLFAANSGMRSGEQFNLHWRCVSTQTDKHKNKEMTIAKVIVDYGTSKKRLEQREFWCRGGEYIERWAEIAKHESNDGFVFSVDGKARMPKTNFMRHWNAMLEMAEFDEERKQYIVPYSLRHFCVSQRVLAGLSFIDIAQSLGTSAVEVERTYNHLQDEARKRFAVADYKIVNNVAVPLEVYGE
jgi:site-specific recombinase XerD